MIAINAAKQARAQGLVTVSDLCQEFDISGAVARTAYARLGSSPRMAATRGRKTVQNCNACGSYSWVIGSATD
jgi:hypothetical protein